MHGVNAELIPPLVPDFNYRKYIYFANRKRTRFFSKILFNIAKFKESLMHVTNYFSLFLTRQVETPFLKSSTFAVRPITLSIIIPHD